MLNKKYIYLVVLVTLLLSSVILASEKITVWMTYGGTTGEVIDNLIKTDFTPKTGIEVEYIPMMAYPELMTKLILEILSGTAPDICSLEGYQVIELGMRGALEVMNQFEDSNAIVKRFYPGFREQFIFNDKIYALPGESSWTQTYVRTDIMGELGLEVPTTWDDLDVIIPKLKANNMNFYYENGMGYPRAYMMFIDQQGADIFTPDGKKSNLDSPEALKAFKTYTSLYTKHKVPLVMENFQGFISGETPFMVHLHFIYGLIDQMAPQIKGKWAPALNPGTKRPDGSINRAIPTSSFAYVIPSVKGRSQSKKEAAWEFLKWYTSPDVLAKIQQGFYDVPDKWVLTFGTPESMASSKYSKEHRETISKVVAEGVKMTSIPGGYSTYRYIDFAFNQVVLQNHDPAVTLRKAANDSTSELERKRKEFARFLKDM